MHVSGQYWPFAFISINKYYVADVFHINEGIGLEKSVFKRCFTDVQ